MPVNGVLRRIRGWTSKEQVNFPHPLDRRNVYSVVDIADYFIQTLYFNTPTVEFKIGAELGFLNCSLTLVRWQKESFQIRRWQWFTFVARWLIYLASVFGTSQGGVIVEVSGDDLEGKPLNLSFCVFAATKGEIIPAILPSIAIQIILAQEILRSGIVPLPDWLSKERFFQELGKREIQVAVREGDPGEWVRIEPL